MIRLIFSILFLCFLAPAQAAGPEISVERAFLLDPDARFNIETAAAAAFTPFDNDLSKGFRNNAVWLRLHITQPAKVADQPARTEVDNARLILRVGPYFLDKIELFEMQDGKWTHQLAGDLYPDRSGKCLDDLHCFFLHGSADKPLTVYLRIENQGIMVVQTEVLAQASLMGAVTQHMIKISISLTFAVGLFILSLILYLNKRSYLLRVYCCFQASIILFLCTTSGVDAQLFPDVAPDVLNILSHIFYITRVFLTVLICWAIIGPYQLPKAYQSLTSALLVLCLINGLLVLSGHVHLALKLNLFVFFINPFVQLYGAIQAKGISKKIRPLILGGCLIYIVMVTFGFYIALGFQAPFSDSSALHKIADWRLNGFWFGMVLFWIIVTEQSTREQFKANELVTLRMKAAQAKANEEKLSDRHTLIDILTHELKNPLGTIKFALASLKRNVNGDEDASRRFKHIDLCVNRMNSLIEHVARSSKIDRFQSFNDKEEIFAEDLIYELIDEYPEAHRFDVKIQEQLSFQTNREMLTVIFENLISNAYKYAHKGAKIEISLASALSFESRNSALREEFKQNSKDSFFEICNVVGIHAAPDAARLFERYYRHPKAQELSGLGIGLSLVQAAAQKIGASVHYLQEEGLVIFTVRIPN
jgi:signal transduction histidine kinase